MTPDPVRLYRTPPVSKLDDAPSAYTVRNVPATRGRTYHVISLEDWSISKEAVGREKDLLAVKELRAIAATTHSGMSPSFFDPETECGQSALTAGR